MTNWQSPLNKLRIQKAVKSRAPRVQLDDGRILLLNYEKQKEEVFIYPERTVAGQGFAPCGYFPVDKILSSHFVEFDD